MATLPFNITDLNSVLGAYARENTGDIVMDIIYDPSRSRESITAWDLMERVVVRDERAWATADFDPEVQEADLAFSDQGSIITVDGRILKMRYMRSDFKIEVHKLYNSWLSHVETESYHNRFDAGDLTAAMTAFGAWIFENTIKKFMEKFMLQTSFQGEYAAGFTAVAGQSFNDAADGFLKLVTDAITAVDIPAAQVVAAGGPLTNLNSYGHYEDLGKAIPVNLYYEDMFLHAAVKNSRNYNANFKSANPGANRNIHDMYKRTALEDVENCVIVPTPEMGTRDTTFITPRNNMIWASNFDSMPPEIYTSVSDDPLVINCTLRYGAGFGFKRYDWIVANDQ